MSGHHGGGGHRGGRDRHGGYDDCDRRHGGGGTFDDSSLGVCVMSHHVNTINMIRFQSLIYYSVM